MAERRLEAITEAELDRVLSKPIDYSLTDARIAAMAEQSSAYLRGALDQIQAKSL